MQVDITKACADSLRLVAQSNFGIQLKQSHAHELVAAYFGYSSRAALIADKKCPISNVSQAKFIVLTSTNQIQERLHKLDPFSQELPIELVESVYSPLYKENWILCPVWPSFEELGKELADRHWKSKSRYFKDMKIQREGVKLESEGDEISIVVLREYVSPGLPSASNFGARGIVDVFTLRRVSGFIGYVDNHHHSTEDSTLDGALAKMKDVYRQIINSSQVVRNQQPLTTYSINFADWLAKQRNRNSPLGDLARKRGFTVTNGVWPIHDNLDDYKDYLTINNPPLGATAALEKAWKSYHGYLKKKQLPHAVKHPKKRNQATRDLRRIEFVKNITPIHFAKRTIESFVPGDKAWVSWEGTKAIPVTILEVDERYYTFRIERPINKAGEQRYLRLDEVRSTPTLACINHVTS